MFNLNKEKQLISKSEILKYFNELEIFQHYINQLYNSFHNSISNLKKKEFQDFSLILKIKTNSVAFNKF